MTRGALAWKGVFFVALVVATGALLAPGAGEGVPSLPFADKLLHALLFAGLALIASRAYPEKPRWGIFLALVLYGGAIELAQARTGRTGDVLDLAADAVGAAVVWLAPRRRE